MRDSQKNSKLPRAALLSILLLGCPDLHAQRAGLPAWKPLAAESGAVIVAEVVEGNLWVIDSRKEAQAERNPDGTFKGAADPATYVIGILARVRVLDVIKGDGKTKLGGMVDVLVYGYGGADLPPDPMDKERYVFFLRPVDPQGKEFARAQVQLIDHNVPPARSVSYRPFDPHGCYTPVEGGYAQILVPPDELDRIDKIKQAIAQHP